MEISQATAPVGPLASIGDSFSTMWQATTAEVAGIGQIFSPHGLTSVYHQVDEPQGRRVGGRQPGVRARAPSPSSASPNLGAQSEQAGIVAVLMLLIAINIVFGILNMLPMIPLDGGHVAVAAVRVDPHEEGSAVLPGGHHQAVPGGRPLHRLPRDLRLAGIYLDITHPLQIPH